MLGKLFLFILNRSIAAGWLIAAVAVLRLMLRCAPRRIVCVLWILAAVRLLMPLSLESAFSLIPSRDTFRMEGPGEASKSSSSDYMVTDKAPGNSESVNYGIESGEETPVQQTLRIQTGFEVLDSAIEDFLEERQAAVLSETGEVASIEEKEKEVQATPSLLELLSYVWLAGVVFLLAGAAISYLSLRRKVRISVEKTAGVKICDGIDTPFILGFLSPKIYLPSTLEEGAKEYVLAHERAHLEQGDHLKKVIGYVLLAVYWVNPLLWAGYALFCKDLEIACDEKVVADKGASYRKAYAMALLACSVPGIRIAAYPLAFGEVSVKERIQSVLRYKKPAVWITVVGVVLCGIVMVCFLTDPESREKTSGPEGELSAFQNGPTQGEEFSDEESAVDLGNTGSGEEERQGIFLLEPLGWIDLMATPEESQSLIRMMKQLTDEDLAAAKKYDPNDRTMLKDGQVVLLFQGEGSGMTIYGFYSSEYLERGLILNYRGEYSYFDRFWPYHYGWMQMYEEDFDYDGVVETAYHFNPGSGTGYSEDRLIIFDDVGGTGTPEMYEFTSDMWFEQIKDQLQFEVDREKRELIIRKDGVIVRTLNWERDADLFADLAVEDYFGISYTNVVHFEIDEEKIQFRTKIGIHVSPEQPIFTYFEEEDGDRELVFDVGYSDGTFNLELK